MVINEKDEFEDLFTESEGFSAEKANIWRDIWYFLLIKGEVRRWSVVLDLKSAVLNPLPTSLYNEIAVIEPLKCPFTIKL